MSLRQFFRTSWRDIRALRRQDSAYKRIWSAFGYYTEIEDGRHDTEDWHGRSGPFAACILRVPPLVLQPSLDELRVPLTGLSFARTHPDHFLHITLQELGFITEAPVGADEISPERLNEFVAAASTALASAIPFDIRLGGANAFQDAVFLDVHDRGQLSRMHARMRELAAIPSQPRYAFLPHMTVAHFCERRSSEGLQALIEPWRDRRFGSFTAHEIEIVSLDVREPYPE